MIEQRRPSPLNDGLEHRTLPEHACVSTCAFTAAAVMRCLNPGLPEFA